MYRAVALAVLILALSGLACTKTPYRGGDQAQVDADYNDCYSLAALKANTPPYPSSVSAAVESEADACMKARGHSPAYLRF